MSREALTGPFDWTGEQLDASKRWHFELDTGDVDELEAALEHARSLGHDPYTVTRADFPLPRLAAKLAAVAGELEDGTGVARVFGLPLEHYDTDTIELLWMGLGQHLGALRNQDPHGQLLKKIVDEGSERGARYGQLDAGGKPFLSSRARVASTGQLRWHTDRADIVALLCVRPALAGGLSRLASSVAVRNAMLKRRPDLHDLLFQDIYRSRLGEEVEGDRKAYPLPVFGIRDGKFTSHYSRTYVEAAQLTEGVPTMTDAQWQALDLLAEVASELSSGHDFVPGEIQILNNHVVYHARDAYEDGEGADEKRLLYRLWLCPPRNRALPPGHEVLWGNIEANSLRGGLDRAA